MNDVARYTKKDSEGRYYIESANGKLESNIKGHTYGEAINRFAEFENADVVEVVRCKDCRFWEEYCVKDADEIALLEKEFGFEIRITSACIGECQCKQWQDIGACGIRQTKLNDYCSYGERREENEG